MVKRSIKIFLYILLLSIFCFTGCNNDLLGLFASTALDERLSAKDNFNYLGPREWRTLYLADKNDYSFIVLTDTHIEDGSSFGFEKIADVIRNNTKIAFAVVLGDITQYGSAQDINKFIEIAELFDVPCYPVIGNHDIYFNNWHNWRDLIGSTNYKITGNGITLLFLDSANSFFGKKQLDWLERDIKAANGNIFVFTHDNIFIDGSINMQELSDTKERARFVSILRNKCNIVFSGHVHKRIITSAGNVKYISIEDYNSNKAYCIVTVKNSVVSYTFGKL